MRYRKCGEHCENRKLISLGHFNSVAKFLQTAMKTSATKILKTVFIIQTLASQRNITIFKKKLSAHDDVFINARNDVKTLQQRF